MWEVLWLLVALLRSVCLYPECVNVEQVVDELDWVKTEECFASNSNHRL